MRVSDSAQELDVLRSCSTAVRDWYLSNNLLLNADKSQAIVLGTANQLRSATSISDFDVADVALPVATTLKSLGRLGVILDHRLTTNTQLQWSSHVTIMLERLGMSDIC